MSTEIATQPDLEPLNCHTHSPEIILAGLYAMAAHGGSSTQARALLIQQYGDKAPPERTLRGWRTDQYPRRYQHILTQKSTEIEGLVEHQLRESTRLAGLVKHKLLERLHDEIPNLSKAELGKTAQQVAVTEGVGLDKLLTLTGRPNNITEHRTADEVLNSLEARFPEATDTTAEEDTEDDTSALGRESPLQRA